MYHCLLIFEQNISSVDPGETFSFPISAEAAWMLGQPMVTTLHSALPLVSVGLENVLLPVSGEGKIQQEQLKSRSE